MLNAKALREESIRAARLETRQTVDVIVHLAEVIRRGLIQEWGFPGVGQYCVEELKVPEATIGLRVQVAYASVRVPELLEALVAGRLNLTTAGRLAPHVNRENVERVIAECEGLSRAAVEEYVAQFKNKPEVSSGIRKAPGGKDAGGLLPGSEATEPPSDEERSEPPAAPTSRPPEPKSSVEPARSERFNFRFSGGRDLKEKLLRLGEVLGVSNPTGNVDKIVEAALEIALDKKDPQRRNERRRERDAKRAEKSPKRTPSPPAEVITTAEATPVPSPPAKPSRYIPVPVRDEVLARADFQCEYEHEGRRCSCRTALQVDHVQPYARGGPSDIENLRALCPVHNLWFAQRHYGREFIRAKIEATRSTRSA
ncbi:MAG: HNH endonuclease [Planctomycetes bacterium]|nr:HNH endonuclease [Planctomycetota bacterium]